MSAKMGRPTIKNPNIRNLTIRINEELNVRLTQYCKEYKITKGEVVRAGIERVLSEKK